MVLRWIMKEKTCCFTGHRYIPGKIRRKLKKKIREAVILLIEKGVIYFGAGGALGFDTLAAEVVLSLKRKYKNIKLIMVYPCKDQTRFWKIKNGTTHRSFPARCRCFEHFHELYNV